MSIRYNKNVEFSNWITKKYIEWRGESRGTVSEYAKYLGISQPVVSSWMQRGGKKPRSAKSINALVVRYGIEVYDILGIERPPQTSIDQVPEPLRTRLLAATEAVQAELARRGPGLSQSEADQIARDIFADMGITFTSTTTQKDLPPSDTKP